LPSSLRVTEAPFVNCLIEIDQDLVADQHRQCLAQLVALQVGRLDLQDDHTRIGHPHGDLSWENFTPAHSSLMTSVTAGPSMTSPSRRAP